MSERDIEGVASGFTPVFDVIAQEKGLGLIAAVVFGQVWRHCRMRCGVCYAARETMAAESGLSKKTYDRWLPKLVEKGYLEDTTPDARHEAHVYRDTGKVRMLVSVSASVATSKKGAERLDLKSNLSPVGSTLSLTRLDSESHKKTMIKPSDDDDDDDDDDEDLLLSDLVDVGLSEEVAQGYLAQHGLQRMAHYLAMSLERGQTNPAGYLVTCIGDGDPRIPYTAKRIECIRDRHRAQKALAQPQPLAAIEGDPDPIDEGMCKRRVIWEDALRELAEQMTRGTFDTWLVGSQLVILEVDRAQVQVRDDNAVTWCRERLNRPIRRTLAGILGAPESFEVGYVAAV